MPTERVSFTDKIAQYFLAHPGEWIDGRTLAEIGGAYAWRSRVSDARRGGMTIENRQRHEREHATDCIRSQFWDAAEFEADCSCGKSVRFTISEYRYVPAPQPSADAPYDQNSPFHLSGGGRLGV